MYVRATAKIKIPTTTGVLATIKAYGAGLQYCVDAAWKQGIKNNVKLHHVVYKHLRSTGLPSQLAVACVAQAAGIVKRAKTRPVIRRGSVGYNFPRSANLQGNVLNIRTLTNRERFVLNIPPCYQQYFASWKVCESLLRMDNKGRAYFVFVFSKEIDARSSNNRSCLGVDLGIKNLAVTSDGRFFHSPQAKTFKRKFKYLRSKLQAKGTRASKRLLHKLAGRETRYMTWVNHNVSKTIVSEFGGNKMVMEDLRGIRKTSRGRTLNYWISNWSYAQLQSFIQYKAERQGIQVLRVKPHYTSQLCHKCGTLGTRSAGSFACSHCGFGLFSADLNAARNLAHPMLVERQAVVNRPHLTCDDAEAIVSGCSLVEHSQKLRDLVAG
ncbi:IS200/IS605 family element transposase accessory protein TnpB [Candidatus Woesearchaeota archaeon]|nr:IS200/IS605 family element transposase accessory protein TnpB [Candidatus Woesearchaeota archaeon]